MYILRISSTEIFHRFINQTLNDNLFLLKRYFPMHVSHGRSEMPSQISKSVRNCQKNPSGRIWEVKITQGSWQFYEIATIYFKPERDIYFFFFPLKIYIYMLYNLLQPCIQWQNVTQKFRNIKKVNSPFIVKEIIMLKFLTVSKIMLDSFSDLWRGKNERIFFFL